MPPIDASAGNPRSKRLDRTLSLIAALLIAVGLTILCVLVFVVALSLRLPLVGPWIQV